MFGQFNGQNNRLIFSRWATSGLTAAMLFAAVGCGSSKSADQLTVYPVDGKVTFKGTVPQGAYVTLHSKTALKGPNGQTVVPTAQVQPDGTFELSSYAAADGAPEGDYVLTVEWRKTVKGADGDPTLGPNLLPAQYSKAATSPVKVTIMAGRNDIAPIVLK